MLKPINDEIITGNIYEINSCFVIFKNGAKPGEYMDSLLPSTPKMLCLASQSTYNVVDRLWTPPTAL